MSELDRTQSETAATVAQVSSAIEAAQRDIAEMADRTRSLVGGEALSAGFTEAYVARQPKEVQEAVAREVAALREEVERDLPKVEARRAVRVKPTRQMV
jgi:predicted transcriptional regulator